MQERKRQNRWNRIGLVCLREGRGELLNVLDFISQRSLPMIAEEMKVERKIGRGDEDEGRR